MESLWSNPLFGISLSVFAYLIGMMIFRRFPHPITTPLLEIVGKIQKKPFKIRLFRYFSIFW